MKYNPAAENQIANFYNGGEVVLTEYGMHAGNGIQGVRPVIMADSVTSLTTAAIDERLEQIDRSTRIVEHNGRQFEISLANVGADPSQAMLQALTYSSCIVGRRGNPGNAYELAVQAALTPNILQVCVANIGNGATSKLTLAEYKHYVRTGRLTDLNESGQSIALPIVQALSGALDSLDIKVTRLGDDSAGGRLATALGVCLAEGQVRSAFHNGIPNMYDHTRRSVIGAMLLKENFVNRRHNAATSDDPWRVTKQRIGHSRELMPRIYGTDPSDLAVIDKNLVTIMRKLWSDADALRIGPRGGDPLAHDMQAFVSRQPEAHTTFLMSQYDPLYLGKEYISRAYDLLGKVAVAGNAPAKVWELAGMTHAFHTHYTSLYQSIKLQALDLA